jgi:hypothetical protein
MRPPDPAAHPALVKDFGTDCANPAAPRLSCRRATGARRLPSRADHRIPGDTASLAASPKRPRRSRERLRSHENTMRSRPHQPRRDRRPATGRRQEAAGRDDRTHRHRHRPTTRAVETRQSTAVSLSGYGKPCAADPRHDEKQRMVELWRWVMVDRKRINATVSDLAGSCSGRVALMLDAMLAPLVGNPVRGLNRPRNAAQQTGAARPVRACGRHRDSTAHHCILPRRRLKHHDHGADQLGGGGAADQRHRHASSRLSHRARPAKAYPPWTSSTERPSPFSSRRAAVQAACEPAPIGVPVTGHPVRDLDESRGRTTLDIKTR